MATISQIDANRQNSKNSTGPRSAEGKAASSQNALKTGIDAESLIIRGESRTDLEALTVQYQDRFLPATPDQCVLVDALIHSDWLLRRLRKIEPQIWEKDFQRCEKYDEYKKDFPLGDAMPRIDQTLNRLQRRLDSTERSYHRALKSIEHLRPDCFEPPTAPPTAPEADPLPPVTPVPATEPTEIGFVPQNTEPPYPADAQRTSNPVAEATPDSPQAAPAINFPPANPSNPERH